MKYTKNRPKSEDDYIIINSSKIPYIKTAHKEGTKIFQGAEERITYRRLLGKGRMNYEKRII